MGLELLLQGLLPPLVLLHYRDNALRLPTDPREGNRMEDGRCHPGGLPPPLAVCHDDFHLEGRVGIHRGTAPMISTFYRPPLY